jgi:DedD protein
VLIAVVGLPRILDNKPKAVNNDIAVNIVTSLPTPNADPKPEPKLEEKAKVETKQEAPAEAPKVATPAPEVKAEAKTETKPVAPSKAPALGLAAGEEVVATSSSAKAKSDNSAKTSETAAPKSSVNYTIPVGSFVTAESIKFATAKLKEFKIPYFTKTTTKSDGKKYIAFIAGPFTDRDVAEAAEKKIKATLYPAAKILENGKQ